LAGLQSYTSCSAMSGTTSPPNEAQKVDECTPLNSQPQSQTLVNYLTHPSLWRCFPTAILHLTIVELRAVFTVLVSWYALSFAYMKISPLCANVSEEKCNDFANANFGMICGPVIIFIVYVFVSYFQHGAPLSFGSGAYLVWSWHLEKCTTYKVLLVFISFFPMLNFLILVVDIIDRGRLYGEWSAADYTGTKDGSSMNQKIVLMSLLVPTILLLAALGSLAFPIAPTHSWDAKEMDKIVLGRTWANLFSESNDLFGFRLIDALWKADSGKTEALLSFLKDPAELDLVQQACREAPDV